MINLIYGVHFAKESCMNLYLYQTDEIWVGRHNVRLFEISSLNH
jgi:hypothetical protein